MLDSLNLESYMSLAHRTHVLIRNGTFKRREACDRAGLSESDRLFFSQQYKHSLAFFNWSGFTCFT